MFSKNKLVLGVIILLVMLSSGVGVLVSIYDAKDKPVVETIVNTQSETKECTVLGLVFRELGNGDLHLFVRFYYIKNGKKVVDEMPITEEMYKRLQVGSIFYLDKDGGISVVQDGTWE